MNFGDPLGLCPAGNTVCLFEGVWKIALDHAKAAGRAVMDLTPVGDGLRSMEALQSGNVGMGLVYGGLAVAGAVPGGEEGIVGSKAAVRAGLSKLGLSDDVARGVRGVLSSGAGGEWGVRALEDGGAFVSRWKKGKNSVSSAIYHYLIDAKGEVEDLGKQAYDEAGSIAGTIKNKRPPL